jgi:hypothetical protein
MARRLRYKLAELNLLSNLNAHVKMLAELN